MAAMTRDGVHGGSRGWRRFTSALALAFALLAAFAASAAARPARSAVPLAGTPAPKVTQQPASVTVEEGAPASFTSAASNSPTIQWERSTDAGSTWHPIEGATSATYSIAATTAAENAYEFRAVFTNSGGSATSKAATLTVTRPPAITLQPSDVFVQEGHEGVFEAAASGSPAPSCQWQVSSNGGSTYKNVTGGTNPTLKLSSLGKSEEGWKYRAVFKNSTGEAITQAATVHIVEPPRVEQQPLEAAVTEGETAEFDSSAAGSPAPTEQWEVSTDEGSTYTPIEGATGERVKVPSVTVSESGHLYRAAFTNRAGTVYSNGAKLTVYTFPVVTEQPHSATVLVGETATFHAAGTGLPVPTIQWQVSTDEGAEWSSVSGAESETLMVSNAQQAQSGDEYRAQFRNKSGTTYSEAVTLTVAASSYRGFGWGLNTRGQTGVGSTESEISTPTAIPNLSFVAAVAAGPRHALALVDGGTVDSWGWNGFGQLGNEEEVNGSRTPVPIRNLKHVKAIAAGGNHSVALLSNGTVETWGNNESGQLGDGNTTESEVPVPVSGLSGVTAVAAGEEHTLALLSNGTVMAWGLNARGQLGDGVKANRDTPVAVKNLSGVVAISAHGEWSMALLSNGTVETWGDDTHDQLGNAGVLEAKENEVEPEGHYSTVPVPVEELAGVKAIAAGTTHALALLSGGTVEDWGDEREGALGNGSTEGTQVHPTAVPGLSGVAQIAAGELDSAALLESGSLETWGSNSQGDLGLGTHGAPVASPTLVSTLGQVAGITVGGAEMIAFGGALPTVSSISPSSGKAAGGTEVTITGTGLGNATAVHFGAAAATSFHVESPTTVVAVAPAGTGTVDVTVATSSGTTGKVPADRFTYLALPTVTKLSAKEGPASGGTPVTLTGTNFLPGAEVSFGGAAATSVVVNSATSITAVTTVSSAGSKFVTVTTGGGTSATSSKAKFKFTPVIEAVEPAEGPLAGGNTVTVQGAGFAPGTNTTKIKFGKSVSHSVTCSSGSTCSAVVPAAKAPGTVELEVTAEKANSAASPGDRYTYE